VSQMRRKQRGIKLHDISGWVRRMLRECDHDSLARMDEEDLKDLEVRFVATILRINLKPRIFLPY